MTPSKLSSKMYSPTRLLLMSTIEEEEGDEQQQQPQQQQQQHQQQHTIYTFQKADDYDEFEYANEFDEDEYAIEQGNSNKQKDIVFNNSDCFFDVEREEEPAIDSCFDDSNFEYNNSSCCSTHSSTFCYSPLYAFSSDPFKKSNSSTTSSDDGDTAKTASLEVDELLQQFEFLKGSWDRIGRHLDMRESIITTSTSVAVSPLAPSPRNDNDDQWEVTQTAIEPSRGSVVRSSSFLENHDEEQGDEDTAGREEQGMEEQAMIHEQQEENEQAAPEEQAIIVVHPNSITDVSAPAQDTSGPGSLLQNAPSADNLSRLENGCTSTLRIQNNNRNSNRLTGQNRPTICNGDNDNQVTLVLQYGNSDGGLRTPLLPPSSDQHNNDHGDDNNENRLVSAGSRALVAMRSMALRHRCVVTYLAGLSTALVGMWTVRTEFASLFYGGDTASSLPPAVERFRLNWLCAQQLSGVDPLSDPISPQSRAVDFLQQVRTLSTTTTKAAPLYCAWDSDFGQAYAMYVLYDSLNLTEAHFESPETWSLPHFCTAKHISCTDEHYLKKIDFHHMNDVDGSLPSELGGLIRLESLQLYSNERLDGTLPSQIGELTALTDLQVHETDLQGPLPMELGSLTNLQILNVKDTLLHGTIPESLCHSSALKQIHVDTLKVECSCCKASQEEEEVAQNQQDVVEQQEDVAVDEKGQDVVEQQEDVAVDEKGQDVVEQQENVPVEEKGQDVVEQPQEETPVDETEQEVVRNNQTPMEKEVEQPQEETPVDETEQEVERNNQIPREQEVEQPKEESLVEQEEEMKSQDETPFEKVDETVVELQ